MRPVVVALLVLTGAVLAAAPAGAATGYAVLADIPAGPGTLELGVDPSLSRLYVSTVDGLEVVDTTTRRVLTQGPVVSPGFLAVDAAAHRVYVTHAGSGTVSVMDGTTNGPAGSFDLSGIVPSALAVDASTHRLYVTDTAADSLVVVDGTTGTEVTRLSGIVDGAALGVDPTTHVVYVANQHDGVVYVVDGTTDTLTATITVGLEPSGLAVDPSSHRVYVANFRDGTVSVIDGTTAAVVATVPVGPGPATLDVNPTTHLVFVALVGRPDVVVMDGTTLAVLARVVGPTAKGPVVVDAAIDNVFVADLDNDTVAVIAQGESPSLTGAPPPATVGAAYGFAFTVAGTPAPDVRVSSGALPDGLSLSSAGELTGTPTTAGSFPFEIAATNGIDPAAVLPVTLEVAAPLELPSALPPTGNDSLPLLALGVGLLGLGLAVSRAGAARRPHPPKETS